MRCGVITGRACGRPRDHSPGLRSDMQALGYIACYRAVCTPGASAVWQRWAIWLVNARSAPLALRQSGSVGLYGMISRSVHPWVFGKKPEFLIFQVEMPLGWHFRAIFLLCAPMRRQSEKLSWVHLVNKTFENANRMKKRLVFYRKTSKSKKVWVHPDNKSTLQPNAREQPESREQ